MGEEPRPEEAIGLAELIVAVRDELERADSARLDRNDDALLELREVELELQFEVRRARSGRGGLDFRVLSAGAPAQAAPPQAQRLRVLYGPAFKLVELDEGDPDGVPDWLRPPAPGPGLRPEVSARLEIDDDLGGLADLPGGGHRDPGHQPSAGYGAPDHQRADSGAAGYQQADDEVDDHRVADARRPAHHRGEAPLGDRWRAEHGSAGYPEA